MRPWCEVMAQKEQSPQQPRWAVIERAHRLEGAARRPARRSADASGARKAARRARRARPCARARRGGYWITTRSPCALHQRACGGRGRARVGQAEGLAVGVAVGGHRLEGRQHDRVRRAPRPRRTTTVPGMPSRWLAGSPSSQASAMVGDLPLAHAVDQDVGPGVDAAASGGPCRPSSRSGPGGAGWPRGRRGRSGTPGRPRARRLA